ncbi:general secretion pathway protein GspB [Vibrio bivalvicida]|uniref:General secretion pathway protein GspB n=1 Tax=Vibrio bivalvicida TaxID=1276888 RepID=A0A177XV47_9VIBR|nr:general secretion pathway protein GspB [Vibrio bivalvicida]OAJ92226.1 general secretion pathway protein GspB [Vibrio bivalvicida]
MSKVMQALERSERSHQTLTTQNQPLAHSLMQQQNEPSNKRNIAFAVIPPLLVAAFMVYDTYKSEKQQWLEQNVSQTVIVEVPFEYQVEQAPDFGQLAATYRDETITDQSDWLSQAEKNVSPLPEEVFEQVEPLDNIASTSKDDLLSGVDLSQLSPELAQRFESALNAKAKRESRARSSEASHLSQQAERWFGKLPAMNFQTHVYSSRPNKRWVKINGVEYNQGDWVSDDIELVSIEQQSCLIRFKGELIEVPALYDWQG